ncbi:MULTISPECIES: hypothetical protein [unclassified Lentimonas]|uniref:hypothetical protein n=1 Tax=unclassified Lentimonas TaxID=2630993 RepID=UPI001327F995|nr:MULTISPECIES: hypothetical protein [unclassified Lentimonas]CAA6679314.1 Unannotated [Lentimonas sp. CC4]CAA6686351.1 Unannotated [Lentimonas sp. CC6]CAA7076125.1 Unannotated [Lentimonas sp. CC4]CAA7170882.1 Unannotated [Lentimonas sp. CC21]CAA7181176.1 Unannotated [Lentimonas sp. CC8]
MSNKIINIVKKNKYELVEEDECNKIVNNVTGGTVSQNMGEIPDWMITDELDRVRPIGTTIFTTEHGVELVRIPNGGYHIYHPSAESEDGVLLDASTTFVDIHHAFIWAMHNGLVGSIDDFTRSIDKAMCHNDAKLLNKSNGLMAHKMQLAEDVFRFRVKELLDLKIYRACVLLIDNEIRVVDINESMASTIEQLCEPEGKDYGYPRHDVDGFPKLNSLREELEEAQIGELITNTETCYFVTNCAPSKWDFPLKLEKTQLDSAVWCLPIAPVANIEINVLAISAVTLCVLTEAWLTACEWPDFSLDRASLKGNRTNQEQCAVNPHSPNVFSMENLYNEDQ